MSGEHTLPIPMPSCGHDIAEQDAAMQSDGLCPLCLYTTLTEIAAERERLRQQLGEATPKLAKRPVAFRAPNGKGGWVVTQDENEAIDVADGADYQGLYVRDGT